MHNELGVADNVLTMLRQYGWETSYEKLQAELEKEDDEPRRCMRELFLGWMAAERGGFEAARRHFNAAAQSVALAGWAAAGQAFVAMRDKNFSHAHQLLDQAQQHAAADDTLHATIAHVRGAVLYHQGRPGDAEPLLLEALRLFGRDHFAIGRVLDTLGMIYAAKGNFQAAREFFARALTCKRPDDLAGQALTHGQLGRLYLDWGLLDKAEQHFQRDLEIAQRIGDEFGQAQMYCFLGQVALIRGELDARSRRMDAARKHWEIAAGWLDASIRLGQQRRWSVPEAYARKDRALVYLAEERLADAESQIRQAEDLFRAVGFAEGLAHVQRVWGRIRSKQGQWDEANYSLHAALKHFRDRAEPVEVARTQFELAESRRAAQQPRPLVVHELLSALQTAEYCRRAHLVAEIEEQLRAIDSDTYCSHVYRRVRGRAVVEDTTSLVSGSREPATVLYLDLKGSTKFALGRDPEEVMMTLNQMMAEFVEVLRQQRGQVSIFRGDGFLALFREAEHARRAVQAALDLVETLKRFNQPREVLEQPLLEGRIGIASGEVFLGNVGTYDKMDYTAIGTVANLGARLESIAEPGTPCISWQTHDAVRDRFTYTAASPRQVQLKGLGDHQVWDVVGRASEQIARNAGKAIPI